MSDLVELLRDWEGWLLVLALLWLWTRADRSWHVRFRHKEDR